MEEKRMPARYRMDETGQMRRTWNGKLPEEFNEKDMLLFAIDTDLTLNGRVSADTLDAVRKAGYSYENGALMPLEMDHQKEAKMEQQNNTMEIGDGKYHDICCPTTAEMRKALDAAVKGEYEKAVEKPSLRGALQSAAKEAAARPAPEGQRTADKGAR